MHNGRCLGVFAASLLGSLLLGCSRIGGPSIVTLAQIEPVPSVTPSPSISSSPSGVPPGLGASTLTCLDRDGDRMGVGTGCSGRDADDTDATVQSAAQAVEKWGSLSGFLQHLGYAPARILYVSPTGGVGMPNDAEKPYSQVNAMAATQAGDMLLFRAGTYNSQIVPVSGISGQPTIYMAYPGETATIDTSVARFYAVNRSLFVIDGLRLDNSALTGGTGISGGSYYENVAGCAADPASCPSLYRDITVRNVEILHAYWGMNNANGLLNVTIEYNVIHNDYDEGEHNIYLGSREQPSRNVVTRGNILYNSGKGGNAWKFNGRCFGCTLDGNIAYSSYGTGFDFENGWKDSLVTRNLSFNHKNGAIKIYNYDHNCSSTYICPYDQTGNIFEHNTFWLGTTAVDGTAVSNSAVNIFHDSASYPTTAGDLGRNVFRNNIIVTAQPGYYPAINFEPRRLNFALSEVATTTFVNNIVFSTYPGTTAVVSLGEPGSAGYGYKGYTCTELAAMTTVENCINQNPMFMDVMAAYYSEPGRFDFRLKPGSPAIEAGIAGTSVFADILGIAQTSPPTIGAFVGR